MKKLALAIFVSSTAYAAPATPVWRADAAKIRAFVESLETQAGDKPAPLSTRAALRIGKGLGDKPAAGSVQHFLSNEQRWHLVDRAARDAGTTSMALPAQLALANLRTQHRDGTRALFRSSKGSRARMQTILHGLRDSVTLDADGTGEVPAYLAHFYDTYAHAESAGVDMTSASYRGPYDQTNMYDRVTVEGAGRTLALKIQRDPNNANDARVLTESDDGILQLAHAVSRPGHEAQPVYLERLNTPTLEELGLLLSHASFRGAYQNKQPFAERAKAEIGKLVQSRMIAERVQRNETRDEVARTIRLGLREQAPAPVPTAGPPGAATMRLEMKMDALHIGRQDNGLSRRRLVERTIGAAGAHPGPAEVQAVLALLDEGAKGPTMITANDAFMLGSIVPHAVLGVTDARIASAFAATTSKVPAEGSPVTLATVKKLFDDAGFHDLDPAHVLHALDVAAVARHNDDVLSRIDTPIPLAGAGTFSVHINRGNTNPLKYALATFEDRSRAADFRYPLTFAGFSASDAATVLPSVAGLRSPSTTSDVTVASPPAGVWAELLNPGTESGQKLYALAKKARVTVPLKSREQPYAPHYARPLSAMYADHAIERSLWRSTNAGEPLVASGSADGVIAKQGEDTYTLADGALLVNDREIIHTSTGPTPTPIALDHMRATIVGKHIALVPTFSEPELDRLRAMTRYGGARNANDFELQRRLGRGVQVFDTETRDWNQHVGRYDPADSKLYAFAKDESEKLARLVR